MKNLFSAVVTTSIAALLAAPASHADTLYWDNSGGTANSWGDVNNWSTTVDGGSTPGAIPGALDVATFSATPIVGTAQTVDLLADRSVQGIAVASTVTQSITIQGGGAIRTLTIGADGVTNASNGAGFVHIGVSGSATQNVNLTLNGSQSWANNGSRPIRVRGAVTGIGNPTLTNNGTGTGDVAFSGSIDTTVNKFVQDSATSTLFLRAGFTTANTFSGDVEVRQGRLHFGNADSNLGAGTLTLGVNSGTGAVTAQVVDPSNRSFANPILLATGHTGTITILMTEDNPASPGNVNSKTFTGGITGTNSLTIENNGGNDTLTFSTGAINNVGAITHTGTGTGDTTINSVIGTNVTGVTQNSATSKMVLSGTNTYTGDTTVSAGILAVDGDAIPNTGKLVINGGKVDPSGATETVASLFFGAVQQATGTWGSTSSTATNKNDTYFTGTGVINVVPFVAPSGFANWQSANSTAGGLGDDHDNDGVDNGLEWFLGGNNDTTGFTALPGVINTGGTLSVTWVRHPDYPGFPGNYGTDFRVETSATLANPWIPATTGVGAGFVEITGNNVKFTFPAGVKDFARLVVTGP